MHVLNASDWFLRKLILVSVQALETWISQIAKLISVYYRSIWFTSLPSLRLPFFNLLRKIVILSYLSGLPFPLFTQLCAQSLVHICTHLQHFAFVLSIAWKKEITCIQYVITSSIIIIFVQNLFLEQIFKFDWESNSDIFCKNFILACSSSSFISIWKKTVFHSCMYLCMCLGDCLLTRLPFDTVFRFLVRGK